MIESQNPIQYETTLFAEPVVKAGPLTITNSLISSWLAVAILIILFFAIGKKIKEIPRGIQNIFEMILESALLLADSITGNRKKTEKFMPICLTLFLFILINNWLGLLPGVGTMGPIEKEGTHQILIPIFRGGTADLNTTLALAIFAIGASHFLGVFSVGLWKYFNKFFGIELFWEIPGKIWKDFTVVLINPIKAFVGLVEVVGEMAKIASLSFRLFGNIFAGEVLISSMMAICAYFLPIPFMFLEIIVGLIQALVFSMLTLVFMTIASQSHEH